MDAPVWADGCITQLVYVNLRLRFNTNHISHDIPAPTSLPTPNQLFCFVFFGQGRSDKSEVTIVLSQVSICWKEASFWKKNQKLAQIWRASASCLNFLFKVQEFMGKEHKKDMVETGGLF